MRGSQFEDMHVTLAVAKQKEFELHKKKLKNIRPNIKADETLHQYQELNQSFLTKKKLRDTFKNKSIDD